MFSNALLRKATLLATALLLLAGGAVRADDTEIYFDSGSGGDLGSDPMVFFYIEYTPNLASTICTGVTLANIDTTCPAVASIKNYLSAKDISATDTTIDQFEMTRAALKRVLMGLGGVKVGLLMAHANLASCTGGPLTATAAAACSQGGYILKGLTQLTAPTTGFNAKTATTAQITTELSTHAGKKALFDKLDALPSPQGGFSHKNQNKEIYFELFRHLTGQDIYNGHNGGADFNTTGNDGKTGAFNLGDLSSVTPAKYRYDCAAGYTCDITLGTGQYIYTGSTVNGKYNGDFAPVSSTNYISTKPFKWDSGVEDGTKYKSPFVKDCAKVFVINVVDGGGNSADDANTAISAAISSGGMGFKVSNSDTGFEEMVRWLHDKDLADGIINKDVKFLDKQNVTSFFIAKQPQQVDTAARAGGTGYALELKGDAQSVIDVINNIFNQILSVSTTFVSASIPVNVFNRSEVIDNAYIALFQANGDAQPRWVGNVKKLKLDIQVQCLVPDPLDPNKCLKSANRLRLIDALGAEAVSTIDGRINASALTYWTHAKGYDLYDNIDPSLEIAGRDGRSVNRGGAGQQIPGFLMGSATWDGYNYVNYQEGAVDGITGHIESGYPDYRNLYTDSYLVNSKGNLIDIWSSYLTDEMWKATFIPTDTYSKSQWSMAVDYLLLTGAASNDLWGKGSGTGSFWGYTMLYAKSAKNPYCVAMGYPTGICPEWPMVMEAIALHYFVHGYDFWGEKAGFLLTNWWEMFESRRWLMGDPLHSRPLPINYGARPGSGHTKDNPDIRVLVGSNDGFMRMIRNTNPDGTESGNEAWAFIPQAAMNVQKQLMDNVAGGSPIHPYGVDGPPTAYVKDADGNLDPAQGDKVWLFFGMRRGGSSYYGLDITDPDRPTMLWKIDQKSPGFGELGLTFSQPVARELLVGSSRIPVIIFAGGYDINKDIPNLGTNDSRGTAVYIVNAETGELIWKVTGTGLKSSTQYVHSDMVDSIPSEVTAVDSNGDGMVDRVYVGDTGGSVWRLDLFGGDTSAWKATRLLNLGRHQTNDLLNDRRFFHAPDVVPSRDTLGYYDAVVIGSGNRAHPLQTATVDYVYMYKDRYISSPLPDAFTTITPANLGDVTNNCIQEIGLTCTIPNLEHGWKLKLTENGEKALASPLTVRGVVYFSTYIPATSSSANASCGPNEGTGYQYAVSLQDASAVLNYDTTNTTTDQYGTEVTLQIEDRKRTLLSGGIPSENVYVSFKDAEGNRVNCLLSSDLQCGDDLGTQQWSTYWFEKHK